MFSKKCARCRGSFPRLGSKKGEGGLLGRVLGMLTVYLLFGETSKYCPECRKSNETSVAIYRNYQLPGRALNFWFKEGDKLPSCFKSAIWRKEEEVRDCCDFTKQKKCTGKIIFESKTGTLQANGYSFISCCNRQPSIESSL